MSKDLNQPQRNAHGRSHVTGSEPLCPSQKTGTNTGTNCYFGPGTNGVREKKSPMKSMVGVRRFVLFLRSLCGYGCGDVIRGCFPGESKRALFDRSRAEKRTGAQAAPLLGFFSFPWCGRGEPAGSSYHVGRCHICLSHQCPE